jgi:hypothetical protein
MTKLQSNPRFWQNEPSAGHSSSTANGLARNGVARPRRCICRSFPKLRIANKAVILGLPR